MCPHGKSNCEICRTGIWGPDETYMGIDMAKPGADATGYIDESGRVAVEPVHRGICSACGDWWPCEASGEGPAMSNSERDVDGEPLSPAWEALHREMYGDIVHTRRTIEHYRPAIEAEARADLVRDARRYRRLQILGAAPYGSRQLENGTVLCFTNLDAFVDADLKRMPDRGEAHSLVREDDDG